MARFGKPRTGFCVCVPVEAVSESRERSSISTNAEEQLDFSCPKTPSGTLHMRKIPLPGSVVRVFFLTLPVLGPPKSQTFVRVAPGRVLTFWWCGILEGYGANCSLS